MLLFFGPLFAVDPDDIITTIAGNGFPGSAGDGGLAINAQLNFPIDVAFDSTGLPVSPTFGPVRKHRPVAVQINFLARAGWPEKKQNR